MKTQVMDAVIHIDELVKQKQYNVLADHMRMQEGVISSGYNYATPHLMIVTYNPELTNPVKFINMVERHGYHAKRVS